VKAVLPRFGISDKIFNIMRKISAALLLLLMPIFVYGEESWQISALEWAQPRQGEWLVRQPALVAAIGQLQEQPQSRLQIRYPGGDEGVLWAEELQAWLIALGVASNRIERVPGSSEADMIQLDIAQ
jgi:hypothetical protein